MATTTGKSAAAKAAKTLLADRIALVEPWVRPSTPTRKPWTRSPPRNRPRTPPQPRSATPSPPPAPAAGAAPNSPKPASPPPQTPAKPGRGTQRPATQRPTGLRSRKRPRPLPNRGNDNRRPSCAPIPRCNHGASPWPAPPDVPVTPTRPVPRSAPAAACTTKVFHPAQPAGVGNTQLVRQDGGARPEIVVPLVMLHIRSRR